ncbi:hypothetical protein NKR23_g10196 [Pleurostoma richardsiae]|uniref:Allergen Asp f 4 n=1 Tax=Pleurostoma richardsiae TaxID=41990 RepID=A0AA38VIW8_9PEZI|nr:hypothetical protein NKR23_g10196 [Pleurostoma richardsiae]
MHIKSFLLLTALGVSAHPSGHAHLHRHRNVHANPNRAVGDIVTATINGKVVTWTNSYDGSPFVKAGKPESSSSAVPTSSTTSSVVVPETSTSSTPAATTTSSAAVAASSTASSSSSSSSSSASSAEGVTEYTTFDSYCSSLAKKRATAAQIAYTGNTGTVYGCNIMLVADSDVAAKYDNTAKFYGSSSDKNCIVWNKIGSNGGIDGFWGADATTFTLKAGGEQYVALDTNTQGGAACFDGEVEKTSYGEIAGSWVEWDFENTSNDNWSGYDASVIVAQDAGLSFSGIKVCGAGTCSSITSSGVADNAYLAKDADADGIGGKVQGAMKITVDVGYDA